MKRRRIRRKRKGQQCGALHSRIEPTGNVYSLVLDADVVQSLFLRYKANVVLVARCVADLTRIHLAAR